MGANAWMRSSRWLGPVAGRTIATPIESMTGSVIVHMRRSLQHAAFAEAALAKACTLWPGGPFILNSEVSPGYGAQGGHPAGPGRAFPRGRGYDVRSDGGHS